MNEQLGYTIFLGRQGESYAIEYSNSDDYILRARGITEYQDFVPTTSSSDADIKEFIDGEEDAETRAVAEDLYNDGAATPPAPITLPAFRFGK